MTIGRFPRSKLSSPKPNIAKFGQIAKVQLEVLSTVGTTPVLFFEQGGYSGFTVG